MNTGPKFLLANSQAGPKEGFTQSDRDLVSFNSKWTIILSKAYFSTEGQCIRSENGSLGLSPLPAEATLLARRRIAARMGLISGE